MGIKPSKVDVSSEADMTPMIDMTFQLIAFFMILINFSDDLQNDKVRLPNSELAKPPEAAVESPVTLQVAIDGSVVYGGDVVPLSKVPSLLLIERQILERAGKAPAQAHVIIRAHGECPTGKVQELIQICQKEKFEQFTLRAQQTEPEFRNPAP